MHINFNVTFINNYIDHAKYDTTLLRHRVRKERSPTNLFKHSHCVLLQPLSCLVILFFDNMGYLTIRKQILRSEAMQY